MIPNPKRKNIFLIFPKIIKDHFIRVCENIVQHPCNHNHISILFKYIYLFVYVTLWLGMCNRFVLPSLNL